MKHRRISIAVAGLGAAALTTVATGGTSTAGPGPTTCEGPLDVLLTNDDGYQAPGIRAVRAALIEAGHRVTTVAPANEQSGKGGAITTGGTLRLQRQVAGGNPVWSVAGTPVDSVRIALDVVLSERPDVVVSGANFGENIARGIVSGSGTVAAANAATNDRRGSIPAIDISVGMDLSEVSSTPRFPSTLAAFPGAADFVTGLLDDLQDDCPDGRLLPEYQQLHVNYPALSPEEIAGTELTTNATVNSLDLTYTDTQDAVAAGGGDVRIGFSVTDPSLLDGDGLAMHEGKIAIVVYDGDIGAPVQDMARVRNRLDDTF